MTNFAKDVASTVANALAEDLGEGDVTAALIDSAASSSHRHYSARRDHRGAPWVNEVFLQVDPFVDIVWRVTEGRGLCKIQSFLN